MNVQNRHGELEPINLNKVIDRIASLLPGLSLTISDAQKLGLETITHLIDGIKTSELDIIAASYATRKQNDNIEYASLAIRLIMSNLQKNVAPTFSQAIVEIQRQCGTIGAQYESFIKANAEALDAMIVPERDNLHSFIAFLSLRQNYLLKKQSPHSKEDYALLETPQYLYMRAAIAGNINEGEQALERIRIGYDLLSQHKIMHATPILFNACTTNSQLGSCFLMGLADDTRAIGDCNTNMALISKRCGGIGLHIHEIRSADSLIKSSNGLSSGVCPQLMIFDATMRCFNQGSKRNGSAKIWVELWHGDIVRILHLRREFKKGHDGDAQCLFYGMWINDLFMKRVDANANWSLFSSDTAPYLAGLYDGMEVCSKCCWCHNEDYRKSKKDLSAEPICEHTFEPCNVFTETYERYEREGRAVDIMSARLLLGLIQESRRENGGPDCAFKDHVNRCSTQSDVGTVRSSNLCAEIVQVSNENSYASCILSSIIAHNAIDANGALDLSEIEYRAHYLTRYLDNIISINEFPVKECIKNADETRSIGIGLQGVHNLFVKLGLEYDSPEATRVDASLYEAAYYGALKSSSELAVERGPYAGWNKSSAATGALQMDLWARNQKRIGNASVPMFSGKYNWDEMRALVKTRGLRNRHLMAQMPTASTAKMCNNTDSFEATSALIGTIDTLYGRHIKIMKGFAEKLTELGIWNSRVANAIGDTRGELREDTYEKMTPNEAKILRSIAPLYKTAWQVKPSLTITRARERAAFIDQAQSMNLFLVNNSDKMLDTTTIFAWKQGLKTGSYYTHTRAASDAMSTKRATILPEATATPAAAPAIEEEAPVCRREPGCESCSA